MTSDDLVGAGDRWIPERDYEYIESRVPILGVDLILLSNDQGVPGHRTRAFFPGPTWPRLIPRA